FVLLGRPTRLERAQIFSLARLGILLARVQPVLAGLQFSNHEGKSICDETRRMTTVSHQTFSQRHASDSPNCAKHDWGLTWSREPADTSRRYCGSRHGGVC